jgi:nitrilase
LTEIKIVGCQNQSQNYAIEGQVFVLHSTQIITKKGIEAMSTANGLIMSVPGGGHCAIIGPDGRLLAKTTSDTEETILYSNLEKDDIVKAKTFADPVGHYSRPDLMWLGVDNQEKTHVRGIDGGPVPLRLKDAKVDKSETKEDN